MSGRKEPSKPGSGSNPGSPAVSPTQPCTSCTVTLSPKDVKICGAASTKDVTATGTPGGGTFAFSSSAGSVATVAGSGKKGTITAVAQGTAVITVTYSVSGCTCTDTATVEVCTCTPKAGGGRYYAYARKSVATVIGIKAKIKTRYGKVCCENEGCTTDTGYHVAYANSSNGGLWAQTGWGRERAGGSAAITTYRYAEMNGSAYKVNYDTGHAPADGSTHEYRCDLDKAAGKWKFSYDGTVWETFADNDWKNKTGTVAQWVGEIYNKEDDMPGTSGDKCAFTECQYRLDGKAFQDAGLVAGDMVTDDASEWGAEHVSATAFNIWDKKPIT